MRRREYVLKLYDCPLATITMEEGAYGKLDIGLHEPDKSKYRLFPLEMVASFDSSGAATWVSQRIVPKNRRFVDRIFETAGLRPNDTIGVMDICKGLSVNDSYWLDTEGSGLSWADVNLFDNELDEVLALVAYTGYTTSQKRNLGLSSEWTTAGQFAKAWRRINGELVLYKAGSEGFANAGLEPYSEYFCSQIASAMGISHVTYDLEKWNGKLASTCAIMNSAETSYVSFWAATATTLFPDNLALCSSFSDEAFESLVDMIVFDALVCNVDRHGNNYGFLRNNETGEVERLAPLFDHNLALFSRDMECDLPDLEKRADLVHQPCGTSLSFLEQAAQVIGVRQHERLRKIVGFELRNHPRYPVPSSRLSALNRYLGNRANALLSLPVVDREMLKRDIAPFLPKEDRIVPLQATKRPEAESRG